MNPKILNLVVNYQKDQNEKDLLELWTSFQPLVINCIRKFHIATRLVQDTKQDSFIHLVKCLNKYDANKKVPFESYFKMSLSYLLLNRVRKKTEILTVDKNWQSANSLVDTIESNHYDPERSLELREVNLNLTKALETLTEKQYTAVILFYIKSYSIKQITAHMGCSYSVACKHKTTGLKKLRAFLNSSHTKY